IAFHFFDGIAMAFVFEGFAEIGNALQACENESGEGFESGIAGQDQVVLGFEIANVYGAFEQQNRFVGQRGLWSRDVEFIFDVADQLLKNVFDGDYAGGGTELVDYDGEVAAALFEFIQQLRQNFCFGDDEHIVHDLANLRARNTRGHGLAKIHQLEPHPADELLVIKNANNVFRPALRIVNRNARMLAFDHAVQRFVEREIGGQGKNIRPRDHDFANRDAVEFDGIVNHFFLRLRDLAELAAGCGSEVEFVGGVDGAAAASSARSE